MRPRTTHHLYIFLHWWMWINFDIRNQHKTERAKMKEICLCWKHVTIKILMVGSYFVLAHNTNLASDCFVNVLVLSAHAIYLNSNLVTLAEKTTERTPARCHYYLSDYWLFFFSLQFISHLFVWINCLCTLHTVYHFYLSFFYENLLRTVSISAIKK